MKTDQGGAVWRRRSAGELIGEAGILEISLNSDKAWVDLYDKKV
jgi:hypothetical protein